MKAPDKIYLTKNRIGVISQFFHSAPIIEDGFVNIEYIRKDALLEWVKEQASITEKLNGKGAMLKAWNTLIDKLSSM